MNKIKCNTRLLIFISLFLIFSWTLGYKFISGNDIQSKSMETYMPASYPNLEHKEFGEIKSIIEYGENSAIAVHYPIFGHDKIDEIIQSKIKNYIEEFNILMKDISLDNNIYKGELNIDYEVYNPLGEIVSMKFTILENLPYYAHPNIEIYTITFDLSKEKELCLKDIMKGKYLEKISQITMDYFSQQEPYENYIDSQNFQQGLSPLEDNYSSFLLCEDHINFIFQKYQIVPGYLGTPEVKIPYKEIQEFIKLNFMNDSYKETFYSIENQNNEDNEDSIELEIIRNRKVNPNQPMVALTFDDGPYVRATIPILDVLREHNSVATFFVLGNRVPKHKEIVKRIILEGNEIGNHSFNHKQLTTISSGEIKEQIKKTQQAVVEAAGIEPKIMRPTYGSYDNKLKSQVGMPMILWSIDTEDWKNKDPEKIVNHVLENVRDGDIILMHDIFPTTAEAIKDLVPELINRGFQLVTVSELYEVRGEALEVGNIYSRKRQ